jgi:hypothetical protein
MTGFWCCGIWKNSTGTRWSSGRTGLDDLTGHSIGPGHHMAEEAPAPLRRLCTTS